MTFTASDFRKKPVVIQAMQWDGTTESATAIIDWALPLGGTIRFACDSKTECFGISDSHHLAVDTLEGTMVANSGDWIIRGVKGEFYPCRDDIFLATYDAVGGAE